MMKLYNPQLFESHSHKVNIVREKYENLYHQYYDDPSVGIKKFPELVSNTENIINSTYSIKYFGINNDQIGILSRRVPLKNPPKELNYRGKSASRSPLHKVVKNSKIIAKDHSLQSIDGEKVNIDEILGRQANEIQPYPNIYSVNPSNLISPASPLGTIELRAKSIRPVSRPEIKRDKSRRNMDETGRKSVLKNAKIAQSQEPKISEIRNGELLYLGKSDAILVQIQESNYTNKPNMIPLVNEFSNYNTQVSEVLDTNPLQTQMSNDLISPDIQAFSEQKPIDTKELNNENISGGDEISHTKNNITNNELIPMHKIIPHSKLVPKPELYNQYVVNQYLLPKHLKPGKKIKDEHNKPKNGLNLINYEQQVSQKNTQNYLKKVNEMRGIKRQMLRNINIKSNDPSDKPFISEKFKPHEMKVSSANKAQFSYSKLLNTLYTKNSPDNIILDKIEKQYENSAKKQVNVDNLQQDDILSTNQNFTKWGEKIAHSQLRMSVNNNNEMFNCYSRIKNKTSHLLNTEY